MIKNWKNNYPIHEKNLFLIESFYDFDNYYFGIEKEGDLIRKYKYHIDE